ncbi:MULTISPECIES: hypothetical protein [Cyanophyceae]|uniref:Restriction endonuclease n=1 Tax=Leptolyngbya subtilissima DQ-A4 TaxID=2933933 RepID=A0ABV0K824_9CYAN|nr:hypothetical protein [Nodosilinea sp. FACHB-141]MBD2110540.1 hypothetical protein [Nodosilinea sp. FACHB-141]
MPNSPRPIDQSDIEEFILSYSDFAFEIQVKQALSGIGIIPLHGGTYEDPTTQKTREYDFRFTYCRDNICLHAAVECKNISEFSPVLVSCLPRSEIESNLRIFICATKKYITSKVTNQVHGLLGKFHPFDIANPSRYRIDEFCGKSVNQVIRKGDSFLGKDSEIFDKWSQSISSLIAYSQEHRQIKSFESEYELHIFMPFVVIPDERLWIIAYDNCGDIKIPVRQVNNVSVFMDKKHKSTSSYDLPSLKLSHIEFMTVSGFKSFARSLVDENNYLNELCPKQLIDEHFQ